MYLVDSYRYQQLPLISLDDLKAYYTCNESSGNVLNQASDIGSTDAISDSDMIVSGNVTYSETGHVSGVNAIGFPSYDTNGNYIQANGSSSNWGFMTEAGAVFTLTFWFQNLHVNTQYTTADICGTNGSDSNDFQWRYGNASYGDTFKMFLSGNSDQAFTGSAVDDTDWHFYVMTWNEDGGSDNFTFQLDNTTKQTKTLTTTNTTDPTTPLNFGDVSGNEPEGNLQLITVWNRVLTDAEIAKLWNDGAGAEL